MELDDLMKELGLTNQDSSEEDQFINDLSNALKGMFESLDMSHIKEMAKEEAKETLEEVPEKEFVIKIGCEEQAYFIISLTKYNRPELYEVDDCIRLEKDLSNWSIATEEYYSSKNFEIISFIEAVKRLSLEQAWLKFIINLTEERGLVYGTYYVWPKIGQTQIVTPSLALFTEDLSLVDGLGNIIFDNNPTDGYKWPTLLSDVHIPVPYVEDFVIKEVIPVKILSVKDLKKGKIYGFKDENCDKVVLFRFRKKMDTHYLGDELAYVYSCLTSPFKIADINCDLLIADDSESNRRSIFIPTKKQKRKLIKAELEAKFCYELRKYILKKKKK